MRLQEDSVSRQEARKVEIQAQIEAERRATEKYRVRASGHDPSHYSSSLAMAHHRPAALFRGLRSWLPQHLQQSQCKAHSLSIRSGMYLVYKDP